MTLKLFNNVLIETVMKEQLKNFS